MAESIAKPLPIGERMLAVQGMHDLTHAERTVLSVIAYFDGPGGSFPSVEMLCAACGGMSRQRMFDVLKSIESKGRVARRRRRRQSSVYVVHYDSPTLEVTENLTSRSDLRSHGNQDSRSHGFRDGNRKEQETPLSEERLMGSGSKGQVIGWCRECGFDRMGGDSGCCACGSEDRPFIAAPHELQSGELVMPFGLVVTGLDSIEGRRLFMSDEGQAALQSAYAKILGGNAAEQRVR